MELVLLKAPDAAVPKASVSKTVTIIEAVEVHRELETSLGQSIIYAASQLQHSWETALLIVNGTGHISFNLELPFADEKKIAKLIAPEVQDQIPFDLEESILSYRHVGTTPESQADFHVQLLPLAELSALVGELKDSICEPRNRFNSRQSFSGIV